MSTILHCFTPTKKQKPVGYLEFLVVFEHLGDLTEHVTTPKPLVACYLEFLVVLEHLDDLVEDLWI